MSAATLPGLREDVWLGERLGRPAYVVEGDAFEAPDGPAFCYARAPIGDVARLAALTDAGFRLVDVNLRFARAAGGLRVPSDAVVADVRPDQHDDVLEIAQTSFVYDRFHSDPAIADDVAGRVKRDWIGSYLAGTRGHRLLVATVGGQVAGFLAELRRDEVSVIDLIAVAAEHRGRRVAGALIAALADRPIEVGTQAANAPAARVYERLGFVLTGADAVLHLHVGEG